MLALRLELLDEPLEHRLDLGAVLEQARAPAHLHREVVPGRDVRRRLAYQDGEM